MKKRIYLILAVFILISVCAGIYLNKIFLPEKIKLLIKESLEEATQSKVSIGSVGFNIFKGLVLRDLRIFDSGREIISVPESSCSLLIPPIFKKNIILPVIKVRSPVLFLERSQDNTLNILSLFSRKKTVKGKQGFGVFVNKIIITDARVDYRDSCLSPEFNLSLDNLNADIHLSLPASVKFNFKCGLAILPRAEIDAFGTFDIVKNKLVSRISLKNLSLAQFLGYVKDLNIAIQRGFVDCSANINFYEGAFDIHTDAKIRDLAFLENKIRVESDSDIAADIKYNLDDKKPQYSGTAKFFKTRVSGLDYIGEINNINGLVRFDDRGLSSDKITANIGELLIESKISLPDFSKHLLSINVNELSLGLAQKIINEKFNLATPAAITGKANLFVALKMPDSGFSPGISGYADVLNAGIKADKTGISLEGINGKVEFTQGAGSLQMQLALSSGDFSLKGAFSVENNLIGFSQLRGKYLNSGFLTSGKINISNPKAPQAQLSGELDIDLKDRKGPLLENFLGRFEKIKPEGILHAKFDLSGNINDFKSLEVDAEFSSGSVSFYGLKSTDFFLILKQTGGVLQVPSARSSLYEGTLNLSAALNLNSENLPYRIGFDIKGVKLEELKLDTPVKDKDIAGVIQAEGKLNGFLPDVSALNGNGTIVINEGKLWQLNLFQGLGKLIFARDFSNIVFEEGSCGFIIKDKSFFTDSLKLKSNLVELTGQARIGFDSSLDAAIKIHVLDRMLPVTNTLKDVTTAIIGESGAFGVIKIKGTLSEPKYKFQPAVVDIIKGLKDSVLGNIF